MPRRPVRAALLALSLFGAAVASGPGIKADGPTSTPLDKAAEKWVRQTLKKMTLDEKIGQLLAPSVNAAFTSTDSDVYERALHLVRDLHVGALHVFGSGESTPAVLLNANYAGASAARKGDPLAAAVLLNRLQREAAIPLLTTADFEGGAGYILNGTTRLPRAMAIAATRDPQLAFSAGQVSAREGRALGVTVDFYPVVDVNNNPRNPIINIRSFGEDVNLVIEMAQAYMRGIQVGGMLATAKHFPGHGDTAVDTHLGLARIDHPRSRLDEVELKPFKAVIDAGIDAVMSTHIILPALVPAEGIPATLSRPILTDLLRGEMKFKGLVFTDSMSMNAISRNFPNEKAAVMAVKAGVDFVLHVPDDDVAFRGIKAAVQAGEISEEQVTQSVERILRVKARLGLHKNRLADIASIDTRVGTRANAAVAADICSKAITLLKDEKNSVPLALPRQAKLLYLSVIDYASGWREGAPSRALIPALKQRWPGVTSIEITDRTTPDEMDLVRELAKRSDAVIVGTFVRIASYSGRMDLSASQIALIDFIAGLDKPVVAVAFGNPYSASAIAKMPAILLGYEFIDAMEVAAVRALAGETPIGGKLPITLPGLFPFGHGLTRLRAATLSGATARPRGSSPDCLRERRRARAARAATPASAGS